MNKETLQLEAATKALSYIEPNCMLGVGTGSTVNYFIDQLGPYKGRIEGAVASSQKTAERLRKYGIPLLELNSVNEVHLYVDSADEIDPHLYCLKGGGGALTGEKIIASMSKTFLCIADETKYVKTLGEFPVAIEVIPMARSFVAREIIKLKGDPVYRQGYVTDYHNVIIDVYHLPLLDPILLEERLNHIPGVVTNGIFAKRPADILLLATAKGVETIRIS
jgi:ribose 5-phosphate isomerase A